MTIADQRAALDALIRERGEDYASLSRLIGRNAAYVQQFIKRGVPRKLDEADRRLLARYFNVPESRLGGPESDGVRIVAAERGRSRQADLVAVPRLAIGASAGPGAVAGDERPHARIAFQAQWLRRVASSPEALSIIQVDGDSMAPTLGDGDDILVDRGDASARLRDGIYVLRIADALNVKRIALNPATRRLTIHSDNPAYPPIAECDPADIDIIGRVVWAGRRIA